jgi:hypothetical protein
MRPAQGGQALAGRNALIAPRKAKPGSGIRPGANHQFQFHE